MDPRLFIKVFLQSPGDLEKSQVDSEHVTAFMHVFQVFKVLDGNFDFQVSKLWLVKIQVSSNFFSKLNRRSLAFSFELGFFLLNSLDFKSLLFIF